jgi:DNA-binding transcriptional LysR family regulator
LGEAPKPSVSLPTPDGPVGSRAANVRAHDERRFARHVDWNLFKDFVELVRHGGVGAAARATGRQQPSMSAALKRLEEHLGQPLFLRSAQGIALTPAGQIMAEICERIATNVHSMPHRVAEAAGQLGGLIKICTISDIVAPAMDKAMLDFHQRYPGMQIRLDVAGWRDVVEAVARGDADIGLACDSAPREDLNYLPVAREVQQLYCAKASSLFGKAPGSPADFRDQSFVLTGEDEPDELANFRRRHGLGRKVCGAADTLHEARRLIELGFGIGFLPTAVAEPHVAAGSLWPLLLEFQMPSYHLYAVTRAELPDGSPASLLVAAVRQNIRDEP